MSYTPLNGPGDDLPPEPVEEPEFTINFSVFFDDGYDENFTAKELNERIKWWQDWMHEHDRDHPIYLNGTEWNGNQLDDKDMAKL